MEKCRFSNCSQVRIRMGDLMDGELTSSESDGMKAHLDFCAACHREYEFKVMFKRMMRKWAFLPVTSEEWKGRIMQMLESYA